MANNVPVAQQSGIFYDLLPSHSDIIEGSVNVYVDAGGDVNANTTALPPSSFEVLDRIDDYNGSGKKLLVIKITAPCNSSYTVTYVTVHSHEDIQDYGSFALNTVAYQTGNADIGDGYPDDGGNYAVSMSAYLKGLDPNNGTAKRFIYTEATEDILALFPTSSGIYKKVATQSDPTYRKTGVVHNGETYTYSIRMQNDSSTKATDIAILDSVENYRTVEGSDKVINSGLNRDRDWNGTIVSFDLQGIEDKMGETYKNDLKLILYTGSDPVNLDDEEYSEVGDRKYILYKILGLESKASTAATNAGLTDAEIAEFDAVAANWIVADNWKAPTNVDLSDVTAFIVYTGEVFTLPKGESLSFTVKMQAPDTVSVSGTPDAVNGVFLTPPKTYNNVYRSFTSSQDTTNVDTYFYTHYDYTQVEYSTVGTIKFSKRDSETNETIPNVTFNLSGISDYGTAYNETLISDGNGIVTFKNLERGTYQLIESTSDEDHLLDTEPRTVMVDPQGMFTFLKMDGTPMLTLDTNGNVVINGSDNEDIEVDENGNFSLRNDPRYHGDLSFSKVDSLSGEGISGTKFTFSGTSIYNTVYDNIEAVSDGNGNVVFENLEKGTYTLKETAASNGYLPPVNNEYQVTSTGTRDLIFKITGENALNAGTEYQIKNTPTAEMTLQKVDSITKDTLDDAEFTLTANSSVGSLLDDAIPKLTAQGISTSWIKNGNSWVQTVNVGSAGKYVFSYLPEGEYTLVETASPTHYEANTTPYTIKVVKGTDGKKLVIELPSGKSEWEYIRLENGEFATATADTSRYQRLSNNESYDDDKTIIKSWIGGVDNNFPSLHLSTEKPEAEAVKVTIGAAFKTLIQNNRSNFIGLTKETTLPSGKTIMVDRTGDSANETGVFYAWWDSTDKKVHWYSDADIIYLPRDCESLFSGLNNNEIEIDLSAFDFSKVTTMKAMFASVQGNDVYGKYDSKNTKIKTITFPSNIDTSKVTNMDGMFYGCNMLTTLDLTGFNTANVTSMQAMFKNCTRLNEIKLDPTKFTDDSLTNVFRMFDNCYALEQIDFRGFKGEELVNAQSWFANCKKIEYIDLSNFNGGSKINNLNYTFQLLGSENSNGCAIFSNKWNLNNVPNHTDTIKGANFNLYGTSYSPAGYADSCFDIATPAEAGGTTSLSSDVKVNKYFNAPNSSYYTTFFDEAYRNKIITVTQPTTSPTAITFGNYTNFEKYGSVTQVKNTTATADDVGKTSFTFEYVTAKTAVPTSGAEPYEVDETIYLTVSQIVEDNGTYYTVSQKYKYDGTVKAKWTEVGGTAPTQWKCEMQVFDADDDFFAWEDTVTGYTSTADENNPVKTVGKNNKPVITNAKTGTEVGDLELSKILTGSKQKYSKDTFTFKVTMWTDSTKTTKYTMLPFDINGEALFDVIPNADNDDKVIIKGIPANYFYEVEEVGINSETSGLNGEYTVSSSTGLSGTITANDTETAEITNAISTVDLSLTKNVVLKKNTAAEPTVYTAVASSDADYAEWADEDFTFTVTFENLVIGQEYSYTINGDEQSVVVNGSPVIDKIVGNDKSAETVKTITIKGGQTVVFKDIPIGTKYTIVETTDFADTDAITYTTDNDKGTLKSTGEQTLTTDDAVTFRQHRTKIVLKMRRQIFRQIV